MYKKIFFVFIFIILMFSVTNIYAENETRIMDTKTYTNLYKLSEEAGIKLPFIRVFNGKAIFDKPVNHSGISIGSKSIEITDDLEGIQGIISGDTITIKGSAEYPIIIGTNVVIEGNITKDLIVIAESIFITDSAVINRDAILLASKIIENSGEVKSNFIAITPEMKMNGIVGKDFRVQSEKIEIKEDVTINGNIYIETNSEIDLSSKYPNAVVVKIKTNVMTKAEKMDYTKRELLKVITAIVLFVIVNLIIRKMLPNMFDTLAKKSTKYSTYTILIGVVGLVTIPLAIFLLIAMCIYGMAIIGGPLLMIYTSLILITIILAKFIVGSVIFEVVKDKIKEENKKTKEVLLLTGIYSIIYLLCRMPYISGFMSLATVLLSSGIVITGITRKLHKEK
ncbi:MAG: hypothetical protein PHR25_06020 [Clostridia bacterium]|nr:hypothetical protein [Clostridia bacterium]MDD4376317.1 hypothetical protein [Clostridia bacterium]